MIPGLRDGLKKVKVLSLTLVYMYRIFAKDFKVYMFSRRNNLPNGFFTRDMVENIVRAMDLLNITHANILGISQGGMIAQCIAIQYPEKVKKLVLAVISSQPNDTMKISLNF